MAYEPRGVRCVASRTARRWALTGLAGVLVGCGGAAPAPETPASEPAARAVPRYPIDTDRAEHAGQRWRLRATGRESSSNRLTVRGADGETREVEARLLELTAVVTILEVDPNGRQLRVRYDIENLTTTVDDMQHELVPRGSVITVVRGEEPAVDIDGTPCPEELREQLDLVMEMGVDRDDDEVFGSTERRAVGEEWSIDGTVARRSLADEGIRTDALSGRMRVAALVEVDSQPCLDLRGHITIEGLALPAMPEGAEAMSAGMHMLFEGVFPVDTSLHERSERSKMTTTVEVRVGPTQLRTVQTREVRRSFEPLADAS